MQEVMAYLLSDSADRCSKAVQLTVDAGIPHLDRQLTADLTLMGISENKKQFDQHWKKLFGRQPKLPFGTQKELGQ